MAQSSTPDKMKAVLWEGKPFHVAVSEVPIPKIEHSNDAIIRVTTAGVCGSDLHVYHGAWGSKYPPWILGHEGIGIVVQVGAGVKSLKVGDRVIAGCGISCGFCENCVRGHYTFCLTYRPETLFDFTGVGPDFGPHDGGAQAQYIRTPFADVSCFKIPSGTGLELEYITLCDIFPTAWYALDCSGFQPGESVAVFGAGPVGLLCAYSAILRGASRVYAVDYIPDRLEKAASIGAIPIDFTKVDVVKEIMSKEPRGVRRCCDCVGWECLNSNLEPQQNFVLNTCIEITEPTGGIGLIGGFIETSGPTPGAPLATGKEGTFPVPMGRIFLKALTIRGGAAEIRHLQPQIFHLIESGKARPSFVIGRVFKGLDDAAKAYRLFADRTILKPVFSFLDHSESTESAEIAKT